MKILLLGKRKSKSARKLRQECGFVSKLGGFSLPKVIINYGLQGQAKRAWDNKFGSVTKDIPKINHSVQISKYDVLKIAESLGIPTPESYNTMKAIPVERYNEFIIKRNWSSKGNGIRKLTRYESMMSGEYIQKYMPNRTYEIRVTGAKWLSSSHWMVWKKVNEENPEQLAWNHDKGGKFIKVKSPNGYKVFKTCKEYTNSLLKHLHLSFGAADFLYNRETGIIQFIEINTCPGFTDFSEESYTNLFKGLKEFLETKTEGDLERWTNAQ